MLAHALRDARYAIRQLLKSPGFAIVAVLTLALGIGATTAIFSVVNGVLLRPLPYPQSGDLVRVFEVVPQYGRFSVAPASFLDWRTQNDVFERIAAFTNSNATMTGGDGPERVQGATVTWDLFPLLRVAPIVGTGFTAAQDAPGTAPVVVLSHSMWTTRFGGDPNIVGKPVTMNGTPVTVVGVMPAGFYFPNRTAEFWRPLALNPANASRGGHFLGVIARLKPDVSIDRAGVAMKGIAERLAQQYPADAANESALVISLQEQIVGGVRPALLTLLAAVAVVVLIACANVANLLLVRASVREKEIAIRSALGASRWRLVVQMLSESLVLAVAGGAAGLLLAYAAIGPIKTLGATSIPRVADVGIDGTVMLFACIATILTGFLFGLAPAWQAAQSRISAVMKEGGRSSTTAGGRWVRGTLLVTEVALSIVLLVGATLLLRSFDRLTAVDPGFKPAQVLAFQVALPGVSYNDPAKRIGFFERVLEKFGAHGGVESVGFVQTLPMRGGYVLTFDVRGRPEAKPGEEPSAHHRSISPDYFKTMGIPVLKGRTFSLADRPQSKMVAVIDDAFVRKFFPNEEPLGQGIDIGNGSDGFYEIVGVVGNVHYESLESDATPTMYVPFTQDEFANEWIVVRTKGDAGAFSSAARQVVRELDPSLAPFSMGPLSTIVSDSVAQRRFSMLLLGLFAIVALFLAAVGLYGVVSYTVRQRTREIGLRIAIGAAPSNVLALVVGGGMKLVLVGVVLGLSAAVALSSLVETMLFNVPPFDPMSYVATAGILMLVAVFACYVPARRAMRVDPIVALQAE